MTVPIRSLSLVFIAVLLAVAPAVGPTAAIGVTDAATIDRGVPAQTGAETPENGTTQHEDPDTVDEDGDTDSVRKWLEGALSSRLSESAVRINRGQYEQGRKLLGDSYDGVLGKYVDVAGETDGSDDSRAETPDEFRQAKEGQRQLASDIEEYQEAVREYRDARRNGDEIRARRLARDANRLAETIDRTVAGLSQTYDNIGEQTGTDVTDTVQALGAIEQNTTTQQARINAVLFEETDMSARTQDSAVSFSDPARVTGQITLETGEPLAQQNVTLVIGDQTVATQTDSAGEFSVRYRPTIRPLGPQRVSVTYLPTNDSVYLASSSAISVTISQTTPTVSLDSTPQSASFDDRISISGRVAADGVGAPTVPLTVELGSVRLDTVQTVGNGTFTTTVRVPPTVRNGSQLLRASVPLENRALAPANGTRQIEITPTATSLTIAADPSNNSSVQVTGTLTTRDAAPVANQQLDLVVAGDVISVVQTDVDGRFNATVSLPPGVRSGGQTDVTLAVRYAAAGTNLEPTRATTAVEFAPQGQSGSGSSPFSALSAIRATPPAWLLGFGALAIAGIAFWRIRNKGNAVDDHATTDKRPSNEAVDTQSVSPPTGDEQLLTAAQDQLAQGDFDAAVKTAYAAVRRRTAATIDADPSRTHWEWYAACEASDLYGDRLDALQSLTECYERAAFAPDSLTDERARRALAQAGELQSDTAQAA